MTQMSLSRKQIRARSEGAGRDPWSSTQGGSYFLGSAYVHLGSRNSVALFHYCVNFYKYSVNYALVKIIMTCHIKSPPLRTGQNNKIALNSNYGLIFPNNCFMLQLEGTQESFPPLPSTGSVHQGLCSALCFRIFNTPFRAHGGNEHQEMSNLLAPQDCRGGGVMYTGFFSTILQLC